MSAFLDKAVEWLMLALVWSWGLFIGLGALVLLLCLIAAPWVALYQSLTGQEDGSGDCLE